MVTKEEKIKAMLSEIGKHEGVESVVLADESGFPLSSTYPADALPQSRST